MRALIVSKALITAAYRTKLTEMANLGIDVVAVVPPAWREGGAVQRLEPGSDLGFDLIVSPMRWNGHFHVHYYPRLAAIMRVIRPDIVHLDEEPYNLATFHGVQVARHTGIPAVFFSWQNLQRHYPPPFSLMESAVYRYCRGALAGSSSVETVLRSKGFRRPIEVVPQFGVDPQIFSPGLERDASDFRIGFPNRLIPGKAPHLVLSALSRLPREVSLHIVGDGPLRAQLEERIRIEKLAPRVTFRSRLPSLDMPEFLRSVDVVVLPSVSLQNWTEQFGRVLIEAMACGVPVIGSDSGEIPNVVGDSGIIVPEGNIEALTCALYRLYESNSLRIGLGNLGRERAIQRFSHAAVARGTVNLYHRALAG